jgi:hypothetical protein
MRVKRFTRYLLVLLWTLFAAQAQSDWLNLTGAETAQNIAEIYVLDDHVKVKLEIYPGDIETFKELVPDSWTKKLDAERPSLEDRQRIFANEKLIVTDQDGDVLPAIFQLVEARLRVDRQSPLAGMTNPYTGRLIKGAPEDKRVIYAEIVYPFSGQPQELTFTPPLDEDGLARATIGFVAYHRSVPIVDFRYISRAERLELNWQDPWYTKFENNNLSRHHKYPLMLFLYVEPRLVRLESLMRVGDLAEMTGFETNEEDTRADMHARLREQVKAYFSSGSGLTIDDTKVHPDDIVISYFTVGLFGLKQVEDPVSVDDASLLVGVSQRYYVDALPQEVSSTWNYFNPQVSRIPYVETDPAGPLPGFVDVEDPVFSWKNVLKTYQEHTLQPVKVTTGWHVDLPVIGYTTLYSALPDQEQAQDIIAGMLENIRIAYLEKNPPKLSVALEQLTAGEDTRALAAELSKLFAPAMRRGGQGAVAEFDDIKIENIRELDNQDGFSATLTGEVLAKAMHWGHTDRLPLQFQMLVDLVEEGDQWRLADLTVIDLKELK